MPRVAISLESAAPETPQFSLWTDAIVTIPGGSSIVAATLDNVGGVAPWDTQGFVPNGSYDLVIDPTIVSGTSSNWTVYRNKRFVRAGSAGIVMMNSTYNYIRFENCIFDAGYPGYLCTGRPFGAGSVGGNIHDIVWENCWFKGNFDPVTKQSNHPMTFEFTGRGTNGGPTYYNIGLYHCTFDPGGYEGLSFDDGCNKWCPSNDTPIYQNVVIEDCIVKGGGNHTGWPYGEGLEIHGLYGVRVTRTLVKSCRTNEWNLQGLLYHECDWVFTDCVADASNRDPLQVIPSGAYYLNGFKGVRGTTWNNCTQNTGTATGLKKNGQVWMYPGDLGNYSYDNTWTDCDWLGTAQGVYYEGGSANYPRNVGLPS